MRRLLSLILFSLLSLKSLICSADIYVGAGVGTTGINFNAAYYWKNFLGIRGEYNLMPSPILNKADKSLERINRVVDAKTKFSSYGFDVSVRPFFGSWHIDLGFRDMRILSNVVAVEAVQNSGNQASVTGDVALRIAKGIKPYVGMGWNFQPIPILGFNINLNVGVVYTGKWKVSDVYITPNYGSLNEGQISAISSEINNAINEVKTVKDEVNDKIPSFMCFWPVINIGVGWDFDII